MSNKKSILYVQSSGVDTPERTYAPFVLATTAAMMNIEATIYFLIKGVTRAREQSTQLLGLSRGDFLPEAKVVGAATLNDLALDADAILCF